MTFFEQLFVILVLVISLSLYTYNLPYKSKLANVIEVIVQLNFLALLLLDFTPSIRTDLFFFSVNADDGTCSNMFSHVSYIVMLLGPLYYAPVLFFFIVGLVHLMIFIRRCVKLAIKRS